ncbi:MAG TPA: hypothetical protein VIK62_00015 [Verrucomicrobiae bacterium]
MKPDFKFNFRHRKKLTTLLGLALDGSKLDGVVLKRTNGALAVLQKFSVTLALDPLTAAPELVGREIRNQLDAAGVRERDCVVGVPVKWILTAQTELPPLPEADAKSLLQMEAERGFHSDVATLQISDSRSPLADGKKNVLLAGIPNTHLAALEKILAAAKLKPVSFSPGISALQFPGDEKSGGALALVIGESNVALQITAGGGVVALRSLEGAVQDEAGRRALHADVVARETRITLGQLPGGLRDTVKNIRIFGARELAQPLADELELRFEPMGIRVELVSAYAPYEFGLTLPVETSLSAAFSLAARFLAEQKPAFEFLPPKPNFIEQFVSKYSSGRLRTTGAVAAGIAVIFLGVFLFQQFQLWRLRSQWSHIAVKVGELSAIQNNIRQYRSWYGGTFPNLAILRQLSVSFPEDGSVTAKNIEVRDGNTVTCSGTARDYASLLAMQARLRAADGVTDVQLQQVRGKAPMQFVFAFKFNNGGAQ